MELKCDDNMEDGNHGNNVPLYQRAIPSSPPRRLQPALEASKPSVGGNFVFLSEEIWQNYVRKPHLRVILAPLSGAPTLLCRSLAPLLVLGIGTRYQNSWYPVPVRAVLGTTGPGKNTSLDMNLGLPILNVYIL